MACLSPSFLPTFLAQASWLPLEAIRRWGEVTVVTIFLQPLLQPLYLLLEHSHLLLLPAYLLLQDPDHFLLDVTLLLQQTNVLLLQADLLP